MAQDKEWGGHLELQAASMLYNVSLSLFFLVKIIKINKKKKR